MGVSCSRGDDVLILEGYRNNQVPSLKIVLIGDEKVGKSSIFMRYFKNQFDYSYRPTSTVNIENVVKKLNVPEHTVVSVTLWDLPGREEVDLRKTYYRDVDAAIVVVDASDRESVELAGTWKQDVCNHATVSKNASQGNAPSDNSVFYTKADPSRIPVLLLGNKYDLVEEREELKAAKIENKNDDEIKNDNTVAKESEELIDAKDDNEKQVWKYEEQQIDNKEPIPEEIKYIQDIADQHGFIGSVVVSAKDSDGSVHIAIQALVRHLLERNLKDSALRKMKTVNIKRTKQKKPVNDPNEFQPLQIVDVKELDDLFMECNGAVRLANQLSECFAQAVTKFKQDCCSIGMVATAKASLEDCIVGLKQSLNDDQELVVFEDGGFLQLAVKGKILEEEEKSDDVKKVMLTFHSEVVVSSKAILQHCPDIDTHLSKIDMKILNECKTLPDVLPHREKAVTTKDIEHLQYVIDNNRARIKHARNQASECLQNVDNTYKKVKASLLW